MICPSCQHVNPENSSFCTECGNRLVYLVQTMKLVGFGLFTPWGEAWSQLFILVPTVLEFMQRVNHADMKDTMNRYPEKFMGKVKVREDLEQGVLYEVLEWHPIVFNSYAGRWRLDAEVLPNPGTILTTNLE